jgi:hypothetical protein
MKIAQAQALLYACSTITGVPLSGGTEYSERDSCPSEQFI